MSQNRTSQENEDALKRILTERTRAAISRRNIEFVLAHQNDSLDELAAYLNRCRQELGHPPARTEIIGGDFIELRFGSWVAAMQGIGVEDCTKIVCAPPETESTELFQKEYEAQYTLDKKTKREKKAANKEKMRQEKSERKQAKRTDGKAV